MQKPSTTRLSFSIILLALTWRAAQPLAGPTSDWQALVLAAAGSLIFMLSADVRATGIRWLHILVTSGVAAAAAVLVICYGWPRCLLPLTSIGVISLALLKRPQGRKRLAALVLAAEVVVVAGASTVALRLVAWHLHDIPLSKIGRWLCALPGAGTLGDHLTVWDGRGLEMVRPTLEGLGLYEMWYLLVAFCFVLVHTRKGNAARAFARVVAAVLGYAVARFAVVTALAIEFGKADLGWHPAYAILSWLPLALFLRIPSCMNMQPMCLSTAPPVVPRPRLTLITPLVTGVLLVLALGYNDPGRLKAGRVAINETHADWEWTQVPFDTTSYGIRAEYNYHCLREYLSHYYEVSLNTQPLSQSVLEDLDVLIIKTPTEAFAPAEIEAIGDFVRSGGGLLLIGDHTNLFGMTSHLNPIAEQFGLEFRYDDTFDLATTGLVTYRRPNLWFHPCVRNVSDFEFLTSCSLCANPATEAVMIGCSLGSEDADYAHPNFFGDLIYGLGDRFGVFLLAGAKPCGMGRVLLFTDSTCFSNFCMFSPGTAELLVGFVDYLNRKAVRYPWLRPLLWLGCGLSAVFGLVALRGGGGGHRWMLLGMALGATVAMPLTARINAALYGRVAPRCEVKTVLFDTVHTEASFFRYLGQPLPQGRMGLEQFYLCTQRLGLCPFGGDLEAIRSVRPLGVVLVNPCRGFSDEELDLLDRYVTYGGRILILDSILNPQSSANEILSRYGMAVRVAPSFGKEAAAYASAESPSLSMSGIQAFPRLRVYGGTPLVIDSDGNMTVAYAASGIGSVFVAVDAFSYSEKVVGHVLRRGEVPAVTQILCREACRLLETALLHASD
jgi:hypothetical protein